MNINAMKETFI